MNYSKLVEEVTFGVVDELAHLAEQSINDKTPEDTKTLLGNNTRVPTRREWTSVIAEITNNTPYAPHVEYGIRGKKYRYNKPKWTIFYEWVGAWMFRRTSAETLAKGKDIIMKWFDALIRRMNQWTS